MPLSKGFQLGPYEILAPLGAGAMGEVYRAHDSRLNRAVALKVLPQALAADAARMARFTREAQVLASLNHPNIAQIHGIEEDGGIRALVMELVEGRTLDQVIPARGVSAAQFFDISTALADALHAAYLKNVTHRDLKPANIMLSDDGRVKVLDFGLAHMAAPETDVFEDAATKVELTQAGTVFGTVPYMSPEQVEGRALDHRSDLFSLGILLYEMATGARPFRGETMPALMSAILRDHPAPVRQVRPDMPEEVSRLIGRCLEKDSRTRIQTAHEILLELKVQRRIYESGSHGAPVATPIADLKIGVTPFTTRASNTELAEGLTEDITAGLARFPYLSVISEGARYRIEGSVRQSGSTVRVSAHLVDSQTGAHMWAETYTRDTSSGDIFALQDDICSRIVATVADSNGVLVRAMGNPLRERPCDQLTMNELILRYQVFTEQFHAAEHALLCAAFEAALEREPSHAEGWSCLAMLRHNEIANSLHLTADPMASMHQAAQRAIALDPVCQRGWFALAFWSFYKRDLPSLRAAAERAISLNRLSTNTLAGISRLRAYAGDWEEGVANAREAMELNPQHPPWYYLPSVYDAYRREAYEEAISLVKRINNPNAPMKPAFLAATYGKLGRRAEAQAALDSLAVMAPDLLDPANFRAAFAIPLWDLRLLNELVDGFVKAKALVAAS